MVGIERDLVVFVLDHGAPLIRLERPSFMAIARFQLCVKELELMSTQTIDELIGVFFLFEFLSQYSECLIVSLNLHLS